MSVSPFSADWRNEVAAAIAAVKVAVANLEAVLAGNSLSALAALTPSADTFPYFTGASTASTAGITAGGRAILGLTYAADRIAYTTSASAAAVTPLTAAGRALIDDADAAAQRTTLGIPALLASIGLNTAGLDLTEDFNAITLGGHYRGNPSTTGAPTAAQYTLIHLPLNNSNNAAQIAAAAGPADDGLYYRRKNGGTWQSWRQVTLV